MRAVKIALGLCLVLTVAAWGELKRVNLKTGGSLIGEVTESETHIQVRTGSGVVMNFAKEAVESVETVVTPEQEYQKRLARIDKSDAQQRIALGKWAMDQGLLQVAQRELRTALRLDPESEQAELLLRRVGIRIAAERASGSPAETRPDDDRRDGFVRPKLDFERWLVTEEEIYRIRLEELRRDDRVRIRFKNDLIDRFIDSMRGRQEFERQGAADAFRGLPEIRQVMYILSKIDRDNRRIKDDIQVTSDPKFMTEFRSRIWPILANHCAQPSCHGGPNAAGDFRVLNVATRNERVDYTNFLILDSYTHGGRKMINRDRPEDSILLQYGLPPDQAEIRHPSPLKQTMFGDRRQRSYRQTIEWIRSLEGPPHPEYDVKLRVPWARQRSRSSLPGPMTTTQPETLPPDEGGGF